MLSSLPKLHIAPRLVLFAALFPFAACECQDEIDGPWELSEPRPDIDPLPDLGPDDGLDMDPDLAPDMEPDLAPDLPPDMPDLPPDLPPDMVVIEPEPLPEGPWEPEVIEVVPQEQALTDRSSVGVSDDGIIWIGYHSCTNVQCSDPWLTIASNPTPSIWRKERVARQHGTFGLDVWRNDPVVAYLDHANNRFAVARRIGPTRAPWVPERLPVDYTGEFDGLDIAHDTTRMFVTFANRKGDPVALFGRDMTGANNPWARLRSLDVGRASAALERGLNADDIGNLFLVHRDGETGPYGVARYKIRDNIWDRQRYLPRADYTVSSMVARPNGDICMIATNAVNRLILTCGTMSRLERDTYEVHDTTNSYSSLIEGLDGSLMIAYSSGNNGPLRVWRLYPDGHTENREVFSGPSYGVSTTLDRQNRLVISYYTCRSRRCTLELIRQPY
jgi:hypothetical protein